MSARRLISQHAAADDRVIRAAETDRIFRSAPPNERPSLDQVEGDGCDRMPSDADRRHVKEAAAYASFPRGRERVFHTVVLHRDDAALAGRPFRHASREDHVPDLSHRGHQRFALGHIAVNNLDIVAERAARVILIACECANTKAIADETLDDFGAGAACRADNEDSLLAMPWIHHARSTMWINGGSLSRVATEGIRFAARPPSTNAGTAELVPAV